MGKVLILAEGPTEKYFVRDVLDPHLRPLGVELVVTILTTKRVKSGPDFKGGMSNYTKVKREILRLLGDSSAACVTTMFDYYGLPRDFPGRTGAAGATCYHRVATVEQQFASDVSHRRFKPYLQLHEFEGLLFADPTRIAARFAPGDSPEFQRCSLSLSRVRQSFETPEEINDDPATCPNRRILSVIKTYRKRLHGPLIARDIGLEAIRAACPHFNEWLRQLEALGRPPCLTR